MTENHEGGEPKFFWFGDKKRKERSDEKVAYEIYAYDQQGNHDDVACIKISLDDMMTIRNSHNQSI